MLETITDFSVQPSFSAFEALRKYMDSRWIPLPTDFGWRKRNGWLSNLRYPNNAYCGGATPQQGQKLLAIWQQFDDEIGVFSIDYANFNTILPLNNAAANWSTAELTEADIVSHVSSSSSDADSDQK